MHKLVILANIHGNFAALQAVADHIDRWKLDAVVVAGDIVNRRSGTYAWREFHPFVGQCSPRRANIDLQKWKVPYAN